MKTMLRKIVIDDNFIKEWHPKYDKPEIGGDYAEYENLIEEVSRGTISKPIFIRILDWKAPRVKGIIKLDNYDDYAEGIKHALQAPEDRKLPILDDLYGIGVPVASTILHFIYPSIFPIMDIRVSEVLYYSGYLTAKSRTQNNYVKFRRVILNVAQQSKCTLREIDRALFAYHKIELKPKIRSAIGKAKRCLYLKHTNDMLRLTADKRETEHFPKCLRQQDVEKKLPFSFSEAFRILQLNGPARVISSRDTVYTVEAWIMRDGNLAIRARPGSGYIYIHSNCWGKDVTCQGTRAGGIYNGKNNIYTWLKNH